VKLIGALVIIPILLTATITAYAIVIDPHNFKAGYDYGTREWSEFGPGSQGDYGTTSTTGHNFECPFMHTTQQYSNFCKGYDAAIDRVRIATYHQRASYIYNWLGSIYPSSP
jgi:hypothetical protein